MPQRLLFRKNVPFNLAQQHKDAIFEINECLLKASNLSLKKSLPGKQLVILCEASKNAAGYVFLIKNYTDEETRKTDKLAAVAFGLKSFTTGQMSLTMDAHEFYQCF